MVGLRGSGRHPLSYLEPREPESEAEEDSMATSSEEGQAVGGVVTDNSLDYQAKKAWIQNASFRELGEIYTAEGRSGLRAKQHIQKLEEHWWDEQGRRSNESNERTYQSMEIHCPFLDSSRLRF